MYKTDLVNTVAVQAELTKEDAKKAVIEALFETISTMLAKEDKI